MIQLGKRQMLTIVRQVDFGVYLADLSNSESEAKNAEQVLLPRKEVPQQAQPGQEIDVFLYRDSQDRMIATTREPYLHLGETALLKVKEVGKFGAFLDWGLEKDLLLPFREQIKRVEQGEDCLVALYIDKSGRLCATMKVYHYLQTGSPYRKDDRVEGLVYEISKNFGTFVAVDDRYSGLIPSKEPAAGLQVGDRVNARVTEVLEDGKLSLSIREKAYIQTGQDTLRIMQMLEEAGGTLPFGDKTEPELIKETFGMSKNEFKRALGSLYKQRLIIVDKYSIKKA